MCNAPVGEGANLKRELSLVMFVGAHVSTAGGLVNAIERGEERGCESIQIFNQSPRMWRPTKYGEEDFAAFRVAMEAWQFVGVIF
jgi:endonuclease IV